MAERWHPLGVETRPESWFEGWFDQDYADLYADRDAEEAEGGVQTSIRLLPELREGPVLDLACGSGRHLLALRRHNPLAFGLDLSPVLLGRAPRNLKPWLLRADMRHLPIREGSLTGICLWFTPFGYFGDEENRSLMASLSRRLRPGGVLWLDYFNPFLALQTLVPDEVQERGDLRVHIRRCLEGSRIVKRMHLLRLSTGERREALESVHLYQPAELTEMAEQSGLDLAGTLGGYGGEPFAARSPRWIGVFRRRA
ncbi:MAG: class I SAM-dependent methyltransferase [Acidobacteria bacterium]|nr:class I SAM-dependent methyltransferase [Acidobacteriota bacterium]